MNIPEAPGAPGIVPGAFYLLRGWDSNPLRQGYEPRAPTRALPRAGYFTPKTKVVKRHI